MLLVGALGRRVLARSSEREIGSEREDAVTGAAPALAAARHESSPARARRWAHFVGQRRAHEQATLLARIAPLLAKSAQRTIA